MRKILALILALTTVFFSLTTLSSCSDSCEELGSGACDYLDARATEGREVYYAEICVKNYGKIVLLLDATSAPVTVANFIKLANEGFYDGLTFHRIIEGFMIQGGDPSADGTGGSDEEIKGEFALNGHKNDINHIKGVISMARSKDYNSASSQFFICNADARSSLDGSYAAFGYVVAGLDVVDKITSNALAEIKNELNGKFYMSYSMWELWQYYGNGSFVDEFGYPYFTHGMKLGLKSIQPEIKHIRILDSWSPEA